MTKKALVVIDVQHGMFHADYPVYNGDQLLENVKDLLQRARSSHIPVFYIQHNAPEGKPLEYGKEGWDIHPGVKPRDEDTVIQKTTPDSFLHTSLHEELKKQQIEHICIAGIQTEVCVDTTCRRAFSLGYKVTVISDTHSTWDAEEMTAAQIIRHHNRVLRWFAHVEPSTDVSF